MRRLATTTNRARKVFINLPVKNLERTMEFFRALDFQFNKQFTDEKAACMALSEEGYVMLLSEPFFKTFTDREIGDTSKHTEAIIALSCDSRDEVNAMVDKALASGGAPAKPPQDYGFMYGWSFYDVDGHHWEVLWMDPSHVQKS